MGFFAKLANYIAPALQKAPVEHPVAELDDDHIKVHDAKATTEPADRFVRVETLKDDSNNPKKRLETRLAARVLRQQAVNYELLANDGRYCNPKEKVAISKQAEKIAHPLMWIVLPLSNDKQAQVFAPSGSEEGERIKGQLIRIEKDEAGVEQKVAYLPVHWEEAKTLKQRFPTLKVIQDGEVYRGASPRSLFVAFGEKSLPNTAPDIEGYSLKMHLSIETYNRLGGLGGNRDIDIKDARIASMFSHVCESLRPKLSPYAKFQAEDVTMAVQIEGEDKSNQVGMIFRKLTDEPAIPGFGLYSPTTEPLPHRAKSGVLAARSPKPRILAAEAMYLYQVRHPEKSKIDAYIDLFVNPLLDVIMSMAKEGMSMELHSQNFLLSFDPDTGATKNVIIRDLHGMNYDADWRAKRGLPDLFSVANLKKAFPDVEQDHLDAWFKRDGKVRDRYLMPGSLQSTLDFFTTMFWMNSLDSLLSYKHLSKHEIGQIITGIKDRTEEYAAKWGVDLSVLPRAVEGQQSSFWVAETEGVRGRILFRR